MKIHPAKFDNGVVYEITAEDDAEMLLLYACAGGTKGVLAQTDDDDYKFDLTLPVSNS